jgi:hypothetical protein
MVKAGTVGTVLVTVLLGVAVVIGWRSSSAGSALPAGIIATYVVIGMAESDQWWLNLSLPWLWLFLAVLLGGQLLAARGGAEGDFDRAAAEVHGKTGESRMRVGDG